MIKLFNFIASVITALFAVLLLALGISFFLPKDHVFRIVSMFFGSIAWIAVALYVFYLYTKVQKAHLLPKFAVICLIMFVTIWGINSNSVVLRYTALLLDTALAGSCFFFMYDTFVKKEN